MTRDKKKELLLPSEMAGFGFKCGCAGVADGTRCDADFDGRFLGRCDNNVCQE